MNQAELWAAITMNGAAALGLTEQGALVEGMSARISFFKTLSVDEVTYSWGEF